MKVINLMNAIKISGDESLNVLPQTMAVLDLLKAAVAAAQQLPEGSAEREAIFKAARAFENEATVAAYTLEDMLVSVHEDPQDGDVAVASLALGLLYKDFPHPWDEMASLYRHAEQLLGADERTSCASADIPRGS